MTRVVHCRREEYDVYIGRPSEWGNPYSHMDDTIAKFKVATRDEAVDKYREWLLSQPELLKKVHTLKGKVLGCWCRPMNRCHGDVLAEFADASEEPNGNNST